VLDNIKPPKLKILLTIVEIQNIFKIPSSTYYTMNLLFVGAQGCGKGTQAKIISEKMGIAHLSMGDLLRGVTGNLKKDVDSYVNSGKLVPTKLTVDIISQRIKEKDCQNGFILDGFPRNMEQAKEVDKFINIEKVFEIAISDETGIKRLKGRWNCKKCGIPYNVVTSPKPKKKGICDKCGSLLYQREDDANDDAIKKRLQIYHDETEPLLEHYPSIKVDGEQPIEQVTKDILDELK
jgi:adenylate kinase